MNQRVADKCHIFDQYEWIEYYQTHPHPPFFPFPRRSSLLFTSKGIILAFETCLRFWTLHSSLKLPQSSWWIWKHIFSSGCRNNYFLIEFWIHVYLELCEMLVKWLCLKFKRSIRLVDNEWCHAEKLLSFTDLLLWSMLIWFLIPQSEIVNHRPMTGLSLILSGMPTI